MAAPTFAWIGTAAGSTSASSPVYPASGVNAGDTIFAVTWSKASTGTGEPPALTVPTGWSLVRQGWGGTGTAGAGTGPVKITVMSRDAKADGSENGVTLTSLISNPASSSFVYTNLFGLRPATAGKSFIFTGDEGSDTTAGTAFSVTAASNPDIRTDDLVLALGGFDVGTGSGASAETITATGATIGTVTEQMDSSTSSGNAVRGVISSAACTAGAATAAPVMGITSAASVTGVGMVLRVREGVPGWQNGTSSGTGANANSAVVTLPTGIQANDIVLVTVYKENTETITTVPAGFTEETNVATSAVQEEHVFWKRMAGGETGTVTFSWATAVYRAWTCDRISGCIASGDPIEGFSTNFNNSGAAASPNVSLASTSPNSVLYWAATTFAGGASYTPPAGYTEREDTIDVLANATKDNFAGGGTGNVSGTCNSSTGAQTAVLLSLISQVTAGPSDIAWQYLQPPDLDDGGIGNEGLDDGPPQWPDWQQGPDGGAVAGDQAGTATLSGSGSLTATPYFDAPATLSGSGSLSASPVISPAPASTLSGTGTLSASPQFAATATLSGSGSLTAPWSAGWSATLSGSGSLTTAGLSLGIAMSGQGSLSASPVFAGAATLSGTGALSASWTAGWLAALAGTGSLTASPVFAGSATLSGTGSLAGLWTAGWSAALSGSGTLAASQGPGGTLSGSGSLTGIVYESVPAALSGLGSLSASPVFSPSALLSGTGTLTASPQLRAAAVLAGLGTLAAAPVLSPAALLTGSGTLSAVARFTPAATFSGSGTLTTVTIYGSAALLSGSGTLTGTGTIPVVGDTGTVLWLAGRGPPRWHAVPLPSRWGSGPKITAPRWHAIPDDPRWSVGSPVAFSTPAWPNTSPYLLDEAYVMITDEAGGTIL